MPPFEIDRIISSGEYNFCVTIPRHPNATIHGYVLHHRVVMENHLGRLLGDDEEVHHKNEQKKDNRPGNLEVMTRTAHRKLHGFAQGKRYVLLKCPQCGVEFEKSRNQSFLGKKGIYTACSRECGTRFSAHMHWEGRSPEVERAISENFIREFTRFNGPVAPKPKQDRTTQIAAAIVLTICVGIILWQACKSALTNLKGLK